MSCAASVKLTADLISTCFVLHLIVVNQKYIQMTIDFFGPWPLNNKSYILFILVDPSYEYFRIQCTSASVTFSKDLRSWENFERVKVKLPGLISSGYAKYWSCRHFFIAENGRGRIKMHNTSTHSNASTATSSSSGRGKEDKVILFSCPGQLNRWHCQSVIKTDFWFQRLQSITELW